MYRLCRKSQKLLCYKNRERPERNDILQTYIHIPHNVKNFKETVPEKLRKIIETKNLIPDHVAPGYSVCAP